jgi:hypothetical protein
MSALSVRLPSSPHDRAHDRAKREGISINQLVSSALAEKMSALLTQEYLEARGRRGDRLRSFAALAAVPAVEPEPADRLPSKAPKRLQPTKARRRSGTSKGPGTRLRG